MSVVRIGSTLCHVKGMEELLLHLLGATPLFSVHLYTTLPYLNERLRLLSGHTTRQYPSDLKLK